MTIQYCKLNEDNEKCIRNRAATRSNGCYHMRGISYRVREGVVTHYATEGEILERSFGFIAIIGAYDNTGQESGKKTLKEI